MGALRAARGLSDKPVRILVVDNYDSFVFNLVQYLCQLGADCHVLRNDDVELADVSDFDGVLLSPGPGTPEGAGCCIELIQQESGRRRGEETPILGVCLGHQAIAVAAGATVDRAPELLHGKTSQVIHSGVGVFHGLPSPFTATRYHSLTVEADTLPPGLELTAHTDTGVVMGIRDRSRLIEGVQFHPESVLTQYGHRLLANWLAVCGDDDALARSEGLAPVVTAG